MATIHSTDLGWVEGQDIFDELGALTLNEGDVLVLDYMFQCLSTGAINFPDNFTLAGGRPGAGVDRIGTADNIIEMFRLGANNTLVDLTFTHSEAPVTDYDNLGSTAGVHFHVGTTIATHGGDVVTVRNCDFQNNVSVFLDVRGHSDITIEDTSFTGTQTQIRFVGQCVNVILDNVLHDWALGDGIKTLLSTSIPGGGYMDLCTVTNCVYLNPNRDGIDTTGGFKNSTITDSYFIGGFTGCDFKQQYPDASYFNPGSSINENITIETTEFIDCNNAVVCTTLANGDVVTEENATTWAIQNVNMNNSIVESTDTSARWIYLVKDSFDIHWTNVQMLGNVATYRGRSDYDIGLPKDVNGTGESSGPARPYLGDAYYRSLAGPDWSTITYPAADYDPAPDLEYSGDITITFNG